jgi:ubiquinone/menaquinone biosynthesis C-methylase UbiE
MRESSLACGCIRASVDNGDSDDVVSHGDICLQCPRCKADIDVLACSECGFRMEISGGIVHALPPERIAHYARFIAEYEGIREAEGRGSQSDKYYLGLPYKDATGKNSDQWRIRARSFDSLLKHVFRPEDRRGTILDLGAGNCWMSFRLALYGYRPIAVDLLTNEQDGLGAGSHYGKHLPICFPRFRAELTRLPFRDSQFDAIVFNASFHYSEDYETTLAEAFRCLKIGGRVIVSDTPWYSREENGKQMIAERHDAFLKRFGTASDSMKSLEYLTDERLRGLEEKLSIRWTVYTPWYGVKWAMRPWIAKLRGRREPSRFRLYVVAKHG